MQSVHCGVFNILPCIAKSTGIHERRKAIDVWCVKILGTGDREREGGTKGGREEWREREESSVLYNRNGGRERDRRV